jgi:hypothetical protein
VSLSIVNGYTCYSSCDAAKARAGKDPHPKQDGSAQSGEKAGRTDSPAVVLSGVLARPDAVQPGDTVSSSASATLRAPAASLDILA